ncbi:MAG TPA: cupin domain-containing protein [Miltoncostaeaceae bacterium]|nr:cupin domain-containing protein [Miltoncostaeaceae bacterium]
MAYRGQVIENPVSGERITFVTTAADTGGELLVIELELAPDGHAPGLHVHPILEERFEVVSGRIRFRQGLRRKVAGPGEVVVVSPGTVHAFSNAGDEPARAERYRTQSWSSSTPQTGWAWKLPARSLRNRTRAGVA